MKSNLENQNSNPNFNQVDFINELKSIVGSEYVLLSDQHDLLKWEQDFRYKKRGKALAIVCPLDYLQIIQIVNICKINRISIVPQGGNTGLVLGSIPDLSEKQIVLSLHRLNQIRLIDIENMTITVEAGCILQNVQESVQKAGFLFPLSLAAEGSCTIGGNLATNAGGTQVLRYGNTRDLCLGLEVVTAQGELWNGLSGLRKDNTGYDLKHLFIGSEGTLGIITAATFKIYPLPSASLTAWIHVSDIKKAVDFLKLLRQTVNDHLTAFEIMSFASLNLLKIYKPEIKIPFLDDLNLNKSNNNNNNNLNYSNSNWFILVELIDYESHEHIKIKCETLIENALESNTIENAIIAENIALSEKMWHIRENIPSAQAFFGQNIKNDISLPISKIPEFVEKTNTLIQSEFQKSESLKNKDNENNENKNNKANQKLIQIICFGHLGDGNLHYNIQAPFDMDFKQFMLDYEDKIINWVNQSVYDLNGSISAEHGIGSLKIKTLEEYKSKVALDLMRSIKKAFDPQNIMNPNCVIRLDLEND